MKKPFITLRINREGTFVTDDRGDHPQQCGQVGRHEYRYFISIEASNKAFTPEGFVMENKWCDEYFEKTYGRQSGVKQACDSCENMAQRAIEYFISLFKSHADLKKVDLRRIYVRIHGSDVSFIEGVWQKGRTK